MLIKIQNKLYSLKSLKSGNEDHNDIYCTLHFFYQKDMLEFTNYITNNEAINSKGYIVEFKKLNMINFTHTTQEELNNKLNRYILTIGFYSENEQLKFLLNVLIDINLI